MKLYKIYILILLVFLPLVSHSQIIINEIMYDLSGSDTDREWVEIYNSGLDAVTITVGSGNGSWRFVDSSAHILNTAIGTPTIVAGGYIIIAKNKTGFLTDWPSFSGILATSSISLTNTTATLSIKDENGMILDQVTYSSDMGAKGDGSSLQKVNSGWITTVPTPGFANITNTSIVTTNTEQMATTTSATQTNDVLSSDVSSGGVSAHSSPVGVSDVEEKMEFEVSVGRDRLTTIGNNLVFRAVPTKIQSISEGSVIYQWSFGDGTIGTGNFVNHTYRFAGDYSVLVNASYFDKQAVSRAKVKVVMPKVLLTRVLDGIEVMNNSGVEINLEGWQLVGLRKTFIFPKDTLISNSKKITFADEVTGVESGDVQLLNPINKEFARVNSESVVPTSALLVPVIRPIPINPPINLSDIQTKINEVKTKLAQISPQLSQSEPVKIEVSLKPSFMDSKTSSTGVILVNAPTPKIQLKKETSTENINQVENTAVIFEAQKQISFISTIFSWPLRGFNFMKRLFVED